MKTQILKPDNLKIARTVPAQRFFKGYRDKDFRQEMILIEVLGKDDEGMIELRIHEGEIVRFERERFMQARNYAEQRE